VTVCLALTCLLLFFRSCISYSPNSRYILASSLDSKHRLHSCDLSGDNDVLIRRQQQASRDPLQPVRQDAVRTLSGHVNNKFSVQSTLFSNAGRSYVLSGSEDSKVVLF
jgi:WD40 repeat protein